MYCKLFLQSLQEQPGGFGKDLILFPGNGWFGVDGRLQGTGTEFCARIIYELVKGDGIA